jgi:hypothetical protein
MVHFREVQQFRQWWLWVLLIGVLAVLAWGAYGQLAHGTPFGNHPVSDATLSLIFGAVLLLVIWLYTLKLVTEVDDLEIRTQFVPMWRTRHIPFGEINEAQAVTYHPLLDYGGWGIRMGANGWAYNVSGNRGVRILYRGGRTFLIGSQRAEELAQAIQTRLAASR